MIDFPIIFKTNNNRVYFKIVVFNKYPILFNSITFHILWLSYNILEISLKLKRYSEITKLMMIYYKNF